VRDPPAERGFGGKMLRQVDRIAVAGELGEADDVGRGDVFVSRSVMPGERSSKNSVRSGGRFIGALEPAGQLLASWTSPPGLATFRVEARDEVETANATSAPRAA